MDGVLKGTWAERVERFPEPRDSQSEKSIVYKAT